MSLAAARAKAKVWLDLIEQGRDPALVAQQEQLAQRRTIQTTFAVVADAWLHERVHGKQRKAHEVATDVRREFIPRWGNKPITEITALDVRNLIGVLNKRAPAQARNLFGYAKRLFDWAVAQQAYGLKDSPMEKLRPQDLLDKKVTRQHVLSDAELRALWLAAPTLDYPYGPVFQLLALTGQRKSEVAKARWREFDLDKKIWTIPPERMKGEAAHVLPLTDDMIAILTALPRFKKGDHVFSTTFGSKPVNGFSKAKLRLDAAMAEVLGKPVEDFVIHDIRRTMRTHLSALPIPDLVRELVIAHAQRGLHKVYDQHAYEAEKRHALELWAARLRNIVSPPPANVVPLQS
jgi:integrase